MFSYPVFGVTNMDTLEITSIRRELRDMRWIIYTIYIANKIQMRNAHSLYVHTEKNFPLWFIDYKMTLLRMTCFTADLCDEKYKPDTFCKLATFFCNQSLSSKVIITSR